MEKRNIRIATATQKSTNFSGCMAMIDGKPKLQSLLVHTTNSAPSKLRIKQLMVLLHRHFVCLLKMILPTFCFNKKWISFFEVLIVSLLAGAVSKSIGVAVIFFQICFFAWFAKPIATYLRARFIRIKFRSGFFSIAMWALLCCHLFISACTTDKIKDSEWTGSRGQLGAVSFHFLTTEKVVLNHQEWEAKWNDLTHPLLCTSTDTFAQLKALWEDCVTKGMCEYVTPTQATQVNKFFSNVDSLKGAK